MSESQSISVANNLSDPPHHPRQKGRRVHINWLPLLEQVEADPRHNVSKVASSYNNVSIKALNKRYKDWKEALKIKDELGMEIAIGKIDRRAYNRSTLGIEADYALGKYLQQKKKDSQFVNKQTVLDEVTNYYHQVYPRPLRSNPPFPASPQFITRFRQRNNLTWKRHKIRRQKEMTEEKKNELIDQTVEYYLQVDEAVQKYGASLVMNADETAAHAVQHPSSSYGVTGQPNNVQTNLSHKDAITTMPTIAADGSKLRLFVLVKGRSKKSEENKHLPSHIYTDHTNSGWTNSEVLVRYIHEVVAKYTEDKPSGLILDDYDAHKTDEVKESCRQHNIQIILVPPGQTSHAQPLDVSVNSRIKQKARKKWVQDKEERPEEADTLSRAAQRVDMALADIPKETVRDSFDKAVPMLGRRLPR
ncbi:MAG TPA: hypothetical protein VHA52_04785 [Candidatus Babeliaceae bacterium]|nr:hypothetical protein [Candidatus Babeliaceae bacterium]